MPVLLTAAALAGVRPPVLPGATVLQIPMTGRAVAPDGTIYTASSVVSLEIETPPPPPEPLAISTFVVNPKSFLLGTASTGTLTLSRAPLQAVSIPITSEPGLTIASPVVIQPGQTTATVDIGTGPGTRLEFWYTLKATLNGQVKTASLWVRPSTPPPPADLPGPQINSFLNPDGSPLTTPAFGQPLRLAGSGFGTQQGRVTWQGGEVPVTAWSDTEIRVALPSPAISGAQVFGVTRPDGKSYLGMVPR